MNLVDDFNLTLTLIIVACLQALILITLYRSKMRHKRRKQELILYQQDLEQRIQERTHKLKAINNQLYDEIARHEVTEELLHETRDYLDSIINSMPSILIGVTREGYITHWNSAAQRTTGLTPEQAMGLHINKAYPDLPLVSGTILDAIDHGLPQVNENVQHGTGSQSVYTDITVYPLITAEVTGAVIRVDDVTMKVRIENMMIQNEKMMSLGELAAGMAHEINNPLSAILHGVQNIYRRTSTELPANRQSAEIIDVELEKIYSYLNERNIFTFLDGIRDAGERAAKIVSNMLEFSRSNTQRNIPISIIDLIEHTIELAENTFELETPEGVEQPKIIKEYADDVPAVPCCAAEIQQVLINLLRNACQSFGTEEYGAPLDPTLTISIERDGEYALIQIQDNGPGMDDVVRRHIFEPFFTTKEVGQGTGLGLSVSYFIVTEHHDGTIEVDSSPGEGTIFSIRLPILERSN